MTRLNDASIVAVYLDCEAACVRKGLTAKTNKVKFTARDSRGVKQIEAREVTEFRRLIREYKRKSVRRTGEVIHLSTDKQQRVMADMRKYLGTRDPYSRVENEDKQGRIPGDRGYAGPGL